jgi:hypothetical protein
MQVQAATKSDIPAIMRVERMEGYARLIGRWDAGQHATEIENPSGVAGTMAANGSGLQLATIRNLLMAWILTLPAAICLSASLYVLFSYIF